VGVGSQEGVGLQEGLTLFVRRLRRWATISMHGRNYQRCFFSQINRASQSFPYKTMHFSGAKLIAAGAASAVVATAIAARTSEQPASVGRLRNPSSTNTYQSGGTLSNRQISHERVFNTLAEGPGRSLMMVATEHHLEATTNEEKDDAFDAMMELLDALAGSNLKDMSMSMAITNGPSLSPSSRPATFGPGNSGGSNATDGGYSGGSSINSTSGEQYSGGSSSNSTSGENYTAGSSSNSTLSEQYSGGSSSNSTSGGNYSSGNYSGGSSINSISGRNYSGDLSSNSTDGGYSAGSSSNSTSGEQYSGGSSSNSTSGGNYSAGSSSNSTFGGNYSGGSSSNSTSLGGSSGSSSGSITSAPSAAPQQLVATFLPSASPTSVPPSPVVAAFPSAIPSSLPTATMVTDPTLTHCNGITAEERVEQLLQILGAATDSIVNLPDDDDDEKVSITAQGQATEWLLNEDEYHVCPDDGKLIQRWTLAVMYFATGGDEWFQCRRGGSSAATTTTTTDRCGSNAPFVGRERFLSATNECEWAGIFCMDGCVTEIEFGT
jgi:hypothetical protein